METDALACESLTMVWEWTWPDSRMVEHSSQSHNCSSSFLGSWGKKAQSSSWDSWRSPPLTSERSDWEGVTSQWSNGTPAAKPLSHKSWELDTVGSSTQSKCP